MSETQIRKQFARGGSSYGGSAEQAAYQEIHEERRFDRWLDAHDREVVARALRDAADAFEGGTVSVQVFGDSREAEWWRRGNEVRQNLVGSLRDRADRIERDER